MQRNGRIQNKKFLQWIRSNYINVKAVGQIEDLVQEVSKITESFQFEEKDYRRELDTASLKIRSCTSFREMVLSCLITSFSPSLCKFSGNPDIGYTIVNQRKPVQIYGVQ